MILQFCCNTQIHTTHHLKPAVSLAFDMSFLFFPQREQDRRLLVIPEVPDDSLLFCINTFPLNILIRSFAYFYRQVSIAQRNMCMSAVLHERYTVAPCFMEAPHKLWTLASEEAGTCLVPPQIN